MDIIHFFETNIEVFLLSVALISLFIGSFLNVVIYRLPHMMQHDWSEECRIYLGLKPQTEPDKLNLCLPNSHCPQCKKAIRPWHNIPIFSYLWLGGKCNNCKTPISIRYPLVEVLTCIVSVYVSWRFGFTWQTFCALFFTWILICLTFIDLDHYLLPDQLTLLLLWIGLLLSLFGIFCDSQQAIIGAIAGYCIFAVIQAVFQLVTGKLGMGQGDYKLLSALGAFLGWQMLPLIILLASVSGIIISLTHMAIKRHFKSTPLPFGPYLAIAGWVALLWGKEILQYYLQIIQ